MTLYSSLLCTEVARQSGRAYVFEQFTWLVRLVSALQPPCYLSLRALLRSAKALSM